MFILLLEIAILHGLHKLRNRACGMLLQSTCKSLDQFCLTIQYWITKCLWLTAREKGLYIQNISKLKSWTDSVQQLYFDLVL